MKKNICSSSDDIRWRCKDWDKASYRYWDDIDDLKSRLDDCNSLFWYIISEIDTIQKSAQNMEYRLSDYRSAIEWLWFIRKK